MATNERTWAYIYADELLSKRTTLTTLALAQGRAMPQAIAALDKS